MFIQNLYFTDIFGLDNQWLYSKLQVHDTSQPYYQLLTGGEQQRFMLTSKDYTYYWGKITSDYYDVCLLYNPQKCPNPPIKPIKSADIERFIQQNSDNYWQYWANFYAKQLQSSPYHFLYAGEWWILPIKTYQDQDNFLWFDQQRQRRKNLRFSRYDSQIHPINIKKNHIFGQYEDIFCYRICHDLSQDNELLHDIHWDNAVDTLLYHCSHLPDLQHGRVKWWRKKVREDSCPPLLVWYQSQLQGYLLIDGHARLQAYLAENTVPNVLAITPIFVQNVGMMDEQRRMNILKSLKYNLENSKKTLSMDQINQILIQAFNDTASIYSSKGCAKAISQLDEIWLNDVKKFAKDKRIDKDFFRAMLQDQPSYLTKK